MAINDRPERSDIEDLLPWHAAGTLSEPDAARVKSALASDMELARRLAIVREEFAETVHLNESLGAPSSRAMDKLFAAINAEPVRRAQLAAAPQREGWIARFFSGFSARTLAFSASVAGLVIILQAGVITSMVLKAPDDETNYRSVELPAPVVRGAYVLVRFAPQASAADITKFLDGRRATVVDGPKPGGLYRVRVAASALSRDDLARVVRDLQSQPTIVDFVAPSE
jgi:anti-sigma factor RsiW